MNTCVVCEKPLILPIDENGDDSDSDLPVAGSSNASYVDDDVHLRCGCHFHWQCLLDTCYEVTSCPHCKAYLTDADGNGNQKLLCDLKNEGGLQKALDILPLLTEESYLRAYPEERKSRAFLEFCAQGDVPALVGMLDDSDESDEDEERMVNSSNPTYRRDILRYQDQLGSMSSGLHVAIQNQRPEVAWLLLLLASNLTYSAFPDEVKATADAFGITRDDQTGKPDIRALKDADGMTAYDRARILGGIWDSWVQEGIFHTESLLQIQ